MTAAVVSIVIIAEANSGLLSSCWAVSLLRAEGMPCCTMAIRNTMVGDASAYRFIASLLSSLASKMRTAKDKILAATETKTR